MHELNEIARTIPNMGFAVFGIYMAHSLYKTPRKIYQCVFAWLSVYAFWIAIRQMRIRRLEKRVGYDPLTGLKNRTYLLEDAGNMLKKGYDPVQVLFLELDSFKSINDNFGHFAGDNFCAALHAEARNRGERRRGVPHRRG